MPQSTPIMRGAIAGHRRARIPRCRRASRRRPAPRSRQIAVWRMRATGARPSARTSASSSTSRCPLRSLFERTRPRKVNSCPDPRRGEVLDPAADMDPRPEHHVLHQRPIAQPQDLPRMRQPFPRVERVRLADALKILGQIVRTGPPRRDAEEHARRQARLAGRRTGSRAAPAPPPNRRGRRARRRHRQPGRAGGAEHALAPHRKRQVLARLGGFNPRDLRRHRPAGESASPPSPAPATPRPQRRTAGWQA